MFVSIHNYCYHSAPTLSPLFIALMFRHRYFPLAMSTNTHSQFWTIASKSRSCLSSAAALCWKVDDESSETANSSSSDEDRTVLQAKYPANAADRNTRMNLRGHIILSCYLSLSYRNWLLRFFESGCDCTGSIARHFPLNKGNDFHFFLRISCQSTRLDCWIRVRKGQLCVWAFWHFPHRALG